jgi:hypothetical protein
LAFKHGNLLLLLLFPLASKHVNLLLLLPLGTKWGSTLTSFSFSLKGGLGSWEALFFLGYNFQFNLENTCSHKLFEEEKNDQP